MKHDTIPGLALFATMAVAAALPATANPLGAVAAGMARDAGSLHATAEACGDYSQEALDGMLRDQKTAVVAMGVSEAEFDAAFREGFESGKAAFESASPQEREQNCERARSLQGKR